MNKLQQAYMMASGGKWIQSAIKRPGAFTKKAKAAGMGVQEFANKVTSSPDKYSTRTKKQANLAKTLKKIRKGEDGMDFDPALDQEMMEAGRSMQTTPTKEQINAAMPPKNLPNASTLYDAVSGFGLKGDFATRKKLFDDYFGGKYKGTASQNMEILRMINTGKLDLQDLAKSRGMNATPYKAISGSKPKSSGPNPMTKNPEKDLPNFERMQEVQIKAKPRRQPMSGPMLPGPMPKPDNSMYKTKPDYRSYGDNTRVAPPTSREKFVSPIPKRPVNNAPVMKQAPTGYMSRDYLMFLQRNGYKGANGMLTSYQNPFRKGMKKGGMKK